MQSWYAKVLGGDAGRCARTGAADAADCVDVAGVSLAMSKSDTRLEPTAGRSLDHIGFEVKNLPEFLARLAALPEVESAAPAGPARVTSANSSDLLPGSMPFRRTCPTPSANRRLAGIALNGA